jgi:hypothetical protein
MSYDVTPFYGFATFSQNRLDALLRLIVGNLSGKNTPRITLNDIHVYLHFLKLVGIPENAEGGCSLRAAAFAKAPERTSSLLRRNLLITADGTDLVDQDYTEKKDPRGFMFSIMLHLKPLSDLLECASRAGHTPHRIRI